MSAPNSSAWWLTRLVVIGISLGLGSDGYAQNRRSSTNRPPAGNASDHATRSKSAGDATGKDELADDDTVKGKPATRSAMNKNKSTGPSKRARGKPPGRPRAGRITSESSTTVTAGAGGDLGFSGEL